MLYKNICTEQQLRDLPVGTHVLVRLNIHRSGLYAIKIKPDLFRFIKTGSKWNTEVMMQWRVIMVTNQFRDW